MARPSKPLQLVQGHRTKAEKELRAKAESELLTGTRLKESQEVKKNPIAHKEFLRVKKLLKAIKKDDDLTGNVINTHCLLHAECKEIEELKQTFIENLREFEVKIIDENIKFSEQMKIKTAIQKHILDCDKTLMTKRKMILDISKENIMTIQSALRSIPKTPQKKEKSKMGAFMEKRGVGNGSQ